MKELDLGNNMLIDEIGEALDSLTKKTGRIIKDFHAAKKFILSEKNTFFYMDKNGCSRLEPSGNVRCLWIDTGYLDRSGKPLFISMLPNINGYNGHIIGNAAELAGWMRGKSKKDNAAIERNIKKFGSKYNEKIAERQFEHIYDEKDYLVGRCNLDTEPENTGNASADTEIARKMKGLDLSFLTESCDVSGSDDMMEAVDAVPDEENSDIFSEIPDDYNEITFTLLWEKIEELKSFNHELQDIIKDMGREQDDMQEKISYIEEKNRQLEKTLTDVRTYMQKEDADENARRSMAYREDMVGHNLLKRNRKILVVGDIRVDEPHLRGIANNVYGFLNDEIEFEPDYKKLKNFGRTLNRSNRYCAVLFGQVPHKMKEMGDVSGIIAKFKNENHGIFAVDARTKSGELKVTKDSFRCALDEVIGYLRTA